jgi:O-antigen ligase
MRTVRLYQTADQASEALIYLMLIFSPWAFGTTQRWSVWTMDAGGYLLGLLLFAKLALRWFAGYRPPRWSAEPCGSSGPAANPQACRFKCLAAGLAGLTVLVLAYCLTSILNARSTYIPEQFQFVYHRWIKWLPHSYDSASSWPVFWNYFALALSFWAVIDWLPGKTALELRAERKVQAGNFAPVLLLPARLRRLLWVLGVNGGLLAAEAIIQRAAGTDKLLWLVQPRVNREGIYHFGTYAYRNNAAQYFNLLWPAILGFWWTLHRSAALTAHRSGRRPQLRHHLLLPAILLMAAGPIVSASRSAVIVDMATLVLAGIIIAFALRRAHGATKFALFLFTLIVLGLGFGLGWENFAERMKSFDSGLGDRERIYALAWPMAREHPVFGTGPGTFNVLFQFYRGSTDTYWPAQLHNDWLETLITFGWAGSVLIVLAFLLVFARRFLPGGIQCGWRFTLLMWLGMGSCFIHARFDFPFQIYSILFLFLVLCAILFNLSRRAENGD